MTYADRLENTKIDYPFDKWHEAYANGLDQYTDENCERAIIIMDNLIDKLVSLEETALENEKVELFREAVEMLNALNRENDECLIETEERQDLCLLFDNIASAAGLEPKKYGGGDGIVQLLNVELHPVYIC
jgi:hypothetical protein